MAHTKENMDKPLVSVICITYGHEDYIAQALDSFVMQETDFKYQILVGEDKGPDRTAEIVLEYAAKYPDKIIPFIREKNMGAQRNLIDLCRRAGTPYVAFCEGDDFWTDRHKLQKQFDFMEAHPEYRACFHNTKIQADESWYLNNWYIPEENGDICIPSSIPDYDNNLTEMYMDYYIRFGPAHTSSIFYRWDNDREIPEWYYKHIYGDHSLMMIQAGDEPIGYIPETMSVYRRSEVGVIMYDSKTDHFLKSRASWIDMAMDLENYFKEHYNTFANQDIRTRITVEFNNYIRYIIKSGDAELLKQAYEQYPYPASLAALSNDMIRNRLNSIKAAYTEKGIKILLKDEDIQKEVARKLLAKEARAQKRLEKKFEYFTSFADIPKDKSVWVFSANGYKAYSNNIRHLYEYLLAYHPETHPVWLTSNEGLLKLAEANGLPMVKAGTKQCTVILKTAAVAVINQHRTLALDIKGVNKGMKIVRLGNGSCIRDFSKDEMYDLDRFKPQGDPYKVLEENPEQYDTVDVNDETKKLLVEDYENTMLAVAVNRKNLEILRDEFKIPEESIMLCGEPRSNAVADNTGDRRRKILLSPAIRKSVLNQERYVDLFFENAEMINRRLEKLDIYMDLYIDYGYTASERKRVIGRVDQYSHIDTLATNDVFHELSNYELMINDYSNIMFDFILRDRPVVIFNPDKEEYYKKTELLYDYDEVAPGQQTGSWEKAMDMVEARLADPSIDADLRERSRNIMYDMSVNDENNCERIVREIKKRINFDSEG